MWRGLNATGLSLRRWLLAYRPAGVAPRPGGDDYPYLADPVDWLKGSLTDTGPIDVVHWAGVGRYPSDGYLAWWEQCMTLFMRHI